MRWIWRLWVRNGSGRFFTAVVVLILFSVHICSINKRSLGRSGSNSDMMEEEGTRQEQEDLKDILIYPELLFPNPEEEFLGPNEDWHQAVDGMKQVYVYSAYLDRRRSNGVARIIAITKKGFRIQECEVWTRSNTTRRVTGKIKIIKENWNLLYSASFIICELASNLNPVSVAVVINGKVDNSSRLPVQSLTHRSPVGNLSVCVKPFHYHFDRAVWLVEFIEFYRLLGANHFIFYNHTVGENVEKVLNHYQEKGIVTVFPWALPVVSQKEIRTEGIFAALNDCNLRSINRFALTAMVDVDEYLVPRKHLDLLQLVENLAQRDTYVFQNVFFYLYWENDTAVHDTFFGDEPSLGNALVGDESLMPYLLTAYKTRRLNKAHNPEQRSKYIVRPEKVIEVGNHKVWEYVGPKRALNVPVELGISHHYRICEFGGFQCLEQDNHIDRSAHKWLVPLLKRVSETCRNIFALEGRCPVAPPLGSPW